MFSIDIHVCFASSMFCQPKPLTSSYFTSRACCALRHSFGHSLFFGGNPTATHESQTTTGKFRIRVLHRLTEGPKANPAHYQERMQVGTPARTWWVCACVNYECACFVVPDCVCRLFVFVFCACVRIMCVHAGVPGVCVCVRVHARICV